jgi:tRNA (guanine-N7-)-methyltransferase
VVWGEALYLLRDRMPSACCQAFHIYFPDPWPKNKTRRVLQPELLAQFRRLAVPGAVFHWGTDHQEYNETAMELLERTDGFDVLELDAPPTDGIRTSFESKYLQEGRSIYRSIWSVRPTEP